MKRWKLLACLSLLSVLTAACSYRTSAAPSPDLKLRLGYLPNVTHATVLVGLAEGIYERVLGPGVTIEPQLFKSGGQVVSALFAGGLDIAYVGPGPAVNGFAKSGGDAVRVMAGSVGGGVSFVVQPGVEGVQELRGRKIAAPQYANSQDIALRTWLNDQGLQYQASGRGDVELLYMDNAQTLATFQSGEVAGAWVPEPWASRLVLEAGGKIMVDEVDLWPGGRFPATLLVVHPRLLREHPEVAQGLVAAHLEATEYVRENPDEVQRLVGDEIERLTGAELPPAVLERAFASLEFTDNPMPAALQVAAEHAVELGVLGSSDLSGILELGYLNGQRAAAGESGIRALP